VVVDVGERGIIRLQARPFAENRGDRRVQHRAPFLQRKRCVWVELRERDHAMRNVASVTMAQPVRHLDRAEETDASANIVANQLMFTKIEYLLTEAASAGHPPTLRAPALPNRSRCGSTLGRVGRRP